MGSDAPFRPPQVSGMYVLYRHTCRQDIWHQHLLTHAHVILIATLLLKVRIFLGAFLFLMSSNAACGGLSWNFSVLTSRTEFYLCWGPYRLKEHLRVLRKLISVPAANDNFQDSFPVTNKAVINFHIQTFEWADIFITLEWIPRDVIAGSYVWVYVWLYWSRQTDSGAGAPFYISTATPRVPVSLHQSPDRRMLW